MVAETVAEPRQLALPGLDPPGAPSNLLPCERCGSPMSEDNGRGAVPRLAAFPDDRYPRCGACGMEAWVTADEGVEWYATAPGVGARW